MGRTKKGITLKRKNMRKRRQRRQKKSIKKSGLRRRRTQRKNIKGGNAPTEPSKKPFFVKVIKKGNKEFETILGNCPSFEEEKKE